MARPFQRKSGIVGSNLSNFSPKAMGNRDYVSQQAGAKRHEFTAALTRNATPVLATGEYMIGKICQFVRCNGVTSDVPPSPTASNNYQTPQVMNGSKIMGHKTVFRFVNTGTTPLYLDVYECALSFYDALIWNTVQASACPVTFDSTGSGPPDVRGFVNTKTITATLVIDDTVKNFKFIQHYLKRKGTITIPSQTGGGSGVVDLTVSGLPSKVRRSQTGMFFAYFFVNDSDKNGSQAGSLYATQETKFLEIPSSERIPYLN